MPRSSFRKGVLARLRSLCVRRLRRDIYLDLLFDFPAGRPFNVPSDFTLHCLSIYAKLKKRRYLLPRNHYRTLDHTKMHAAIYDTEQTTDQEFLCHYRMTRESFHNLVHLIVNHPVFQSPPNAKRKQNKPEYQLLLGLKVMLLPTEVLVTTLVLATARQCYTRSVPWKLLFPSKIGWCIGRKKRSGRKCHAACRQSTTFPIASVLWAALFYLWRRSLRCLGRITDP